MGERALAEKNQLASKKKVSWYAKKNIDLHKKLTKLPIAIAR